MLDKLNITSSGPPKRPSPLDAKALRKLVDKALEKGPWVGYSETAHATFDHPERHIDINDVLHGLEQPWTKVRPDEFNEGEFQWKYEIVTTDIEGDELTIIIAVDTRNESFEVVTRW